MSETSPGQSLHNRVWWREPVIWCLASMVFSAWLVWGAPQIMNGVDYSLTHHFFRAHLREALWAGELPLWNPYTYLGRPFLADPEVAAYYPATWLFFFLPEPVAYWLEVSIHFALGGWGMSRLVQSWGVPSGAAIAAGVAFVLTPPFLGHLQGGMIGFVCTIAWWPWLLYYTDRLCERFDLRDSLLLVALLTACFLAGHTHAFWLCGCSLGFYIFPRCLYGDIRSAAIRLIRSYATLALAAGWALTICAIELLPLYELSEESNRAPGKEFAAFWSLGMDGLASLWRVVHPRLTGWWDGSLYIGLPMVLLGCWGLAHVKEVRLRALLCMAAVCLVLALGQSTPLFDFLYPLVPAMGSFRFSNRFAMFAIWALIIGAAWMWRRGPRLAGSTCAWWVGLGCVLGCSVAYRWIGVWVAALVGTVMGGLLLFCWARRVRLSVRLGFATWVALWSFDLVVALAALGRGFANYAPMDYKDSCYLPQSIADQLDKYKAVAPIRVFLPQGVLKGNSGMVNGYSMVAGNVALCSARVWYYLYHAAGLAPIPFQNTFIDPTVHRSENTFPYKGANVLLGWRESEKQLLLCPDEDLGERAWMSYSVVAVENMPEALRQVIDGFDPRQATLVEAPDLSLVAGVSAQSRLGHATITEFTRNRVVLSVEAPSTSILVLAEAWFPGWSAQIDGRDAEVFPVNVWMRGVVVPAGARQVVFVYRSTFLPLGGALTLAGLFAWAYCYRRARGGWPQ